ncbi:MAG: ABC transporter ATP-binding protein [Candidatus Kaiserbacteria bacterium]|nr:ABC transporter ATP-binding protein [Candidatus Kaiserbacteria bacterium]
MPVLEIRNLTKRFGDFTAVDSISFAVKRGEIVGLLGPNGAGKTTTIHMLLGITLKNGGSITYFGRDFYHHRLESLQRINSSSAFNTLLGRITVKENLRVFAALYRVDDADRIIDELLKRFEIADLAHELYWGLSSGQRTRVNLIKSLLNDPEIILMDEPTASLDPDIADKTLSLIEELRSERNLSILYTSHNMAEITRICDNVIFLDHGKIVANDTPANLTKRISSATLRLTFSGARSTIESYLHGRGQRFSFTSENTVEISSEESLIPELLFGASHVGNAITDIEIRKPTLEDVFIQIARA